MDQLSLHKSRETKELMDELGFLYTYTPVQAPQFNGIEEVFSIGKSIIKKKRLETILMGEEEDLRTIISEAF
jgi:hypothetical protein